jgi:rhodanese-related sulfurtransferase
MVAGSDWGEEVAPSGSAETGHSVGEIPPPWQNQPKSNSIIEALFKRQAYSVKFIVENWMLILMATASGSLLLWQALQKSTGGAVGTAEAVRLINREKAVLIDVCEPSEFDAGHAVGARNIPLGGLEGAKSLPSNKSLPLVLLCSSGARAKRAAGLLRKAGHEQAIAVAGGMAAWREAGLPVGKKSV